MSNAPNFPPSLPINRPNQVQKDFFPFAAFKSDDPNKTSNPVLELIAPWILKGLFNGTFSGIGTALTNAIVDTAANLASSNPTLLAGQIGYETDTLSFKIGDGSTAYNSLTYFYRGLPVAGEPSLGTPHLASDANRSTTMVVNTSTNTAGVWSAAVTMPNCGSGQPWEGARAAWCMGRSYKAATALACAVEKASGITLSDITSGDNLRKYRFFPYSAVAGNGQWVNLKIPLDASGQFKWCTIVSSATVEINPPNEYEM